MVGDELCGVAVHLLDRALELVRLDAPLPAAADLDGGDGRVPQQCIDLSVRAPQDLPDLTQLQEPRQGVGVARES